MSRGGSADGRGVYGFWPADADGDDIVLYGDDGAAAGAGALPDAAAAGAQGRTRSRIGRWPTSWRPSGSGRSTTSGAFAVTVASAPRSWRKAFEAAHDDYNAIMVKALADRLAEAFAEYLHAQARRDWGYGARRAARRPRTWSPRRYRGIRPAFGYPACPDHTEKRTLFQLLDAEAHRHGAHRELRDDAGRERVSGLYFAHPEARYFMVGRIGDDQVADYARARA